MKKILHIYIYIYIYIYTHTHTVEYYSAIKRKKFCHNKKRCKLTEHKLAVTRGEREGGEGKYRGRGVKDTNY